MAKKRTIKKVAAGGEMPNGLKSGSQLIRDQIAKGVTVPKQIIAAVKAETGVDVSNALVGSVKQAAKRKGGGAVKKLLKAGRPKGGISSTGKAKSGNEARDGKSISAIDAAIILTEKLGAAQARQIISALGGGIVDNG